MAYNSNKGPQHSGDIQFEGDPNDVQIDFENDQVSLKAGGVNRLTADSGSVSISGSLSASADVKATGNIHATAYYGDGSNLSGVGGGASSGSARLYSSTGVETSGFLKVSGSSTITTVSGTTAQFTVLTASQIVGGSPISISASSITFTGSVEFSGSSTISASSATLTSLTASAISGGSPIEIFGDTVTITGDAGIALRGPVSSSGVIAAVGNAVFGGTVASTGSMTAAGMFTTSLSASSISQLVGSISSSGDVAVSGNIHATEFHGDGSYLSGISAGAVSGAARVYSVTGLETSGFLKVSGSSVMEDITANGITNVGAYSGSGVLANVGSISSSANLAVTGAVHAANFYGDGSGLVNVPAGAPTSLSGTTAQLTTGVETSGFLKVSGSSDFATTITASNGINIGNNNASASFGPKALEIYWNGTNGVMESEVGHLNIRVNQSAKDIRLRMGDAAGSSKVEFRTNADANVVTVDSNGLISGSGGLQIVGSISSSADVAVSGNIHATAYYGDGSGLSGVGGSASGSARVYSTTGLETSGFLKVSGSTTLAGTLRSAGKIQSTNHAYSFGAGTIHFIPLNGSTNESTTPDYRHQFVAPFNGRLRRVYARTKLNPNGTCTANITVGSDGTEDFNAGGAIVESQSITISAANTTGTFNLTGSQHFTAGQIIGVAMQYNANPSDVNITCVWEYDDRDV
tara:strand:+ start:15581 stop:17659 length:2079 start_codon:yes stop_codon:yes gene_type:complete